MMEKQTDADISTTWAGSVAPFLTLRNVLKIASSGKRRRSTRRGRDTPEASWMPKGWKCVTCLTARAFIVSAPGGQNETPDRLPPWKRYVWK